MFHAVLVNNKEVKPFIIFRPEHRHLLVQKGAVKAFVPNRSKAVPLKCTINPVSILSAHQYKKDLRPPHGAARVERPPWSGPRGATPVERPSWSADVRGDPGKQFGWQGGKPRIVPDLNLATFLKCIY